jgi:hypothetical protein
MRNAPFRLLQALLGLASLSHVIIGGGIMLSPEFQRTMASAYGAEVVWTAQLIYILRPMGAFMFVLGLLLAAAALDPVRHRLIVYGLCAVLLLRVLQRLTLQQDIQDAFAVSPGVNLGMAGLFLAEAIAILVLLHWPGKAVVADAGSARPQ